jgi:hypothetical protein
MFAHKHVTVQSTIQEPAIACVEQVHVVMREKSACSKSPKMSTGSYLWTTVTT